MELNINLDNIVTPNFRKAFIEVLNCEVSMAVFKGGRASIKSTIAAYIIIIGCMTYEASAVCCLKIASNVKQRLVDSFLEVIDRLGVQQFWKWRKSPDELVLLDKNGKETRHSIRFIGMENPKLKKSYKARSIGFKYCFVEEATDFESMEEIKLIKQTMLRGEVAGGQCIILAYNPPLFKSNWVNQEFDKPVGRALGYSSDYYYETKELKDEYTGDTEYIRTLIHHSTLYDIAKAGHRSWLGAQYNEARQSKIENPKYHNWVYLGSVEGGDDTQVFWNIHDWDGDISNLRLNTLNRGLDHSNGGADPTTGVVWFFDRINKRIYAIDEFYGSKMSIEQTAQAIKLINKHNFPVYADSAVPILNTQLNSRGLNIIGAKKPPGSVEAGIKWLQSLNGIYICRQKTPNIYREFNGYEWEITKDEVITHNLPDKDNHTIDATRYAFSIEIKYD